MMPVTMSMKMICMVDMSLVIVVGMVVRVVRMRSVSMSIVMMVVMMMMV